MFGFRLRPLVAIVLRKYYGLVRRLDSATSRNMDHFHGYFVFELILLSALDFAKFRNVHQRI